ncbi:GNAT family N-acetyltransferase [Caldicellulosiruptoraceae bacterium PP1]
MEFVVRKAKIEDAISIKAVTHEAFIKYCELADIDPTNNAAVNETIDEIINDINNKEVYVAFIDGELVGSIRVEIFPDKTAYISRFGVKLSFQNNGVGKALMKVVDERLIELGVKRVYLHTASKVKDLVRFYYARGFYIEEVSKEKGYLRALLCKEYQ